MFYYKTNTKKEHSSITGTRYSLPILAIVMGIILCLLSDLSAGTSSVHTNLLFLHSYFNNKHWQRSGDTLDYNLPSSYTNLTPVKAFMAGNDSNNIALFSTSDKLYLMHAVLESPPTVTSNNKMAVDDPVESPVGSVDSVFGIFAYTADNLDIVFLAAVASNKIAVHHMIGQSFNVFKTDTLTINLPNPNCRITRLYGGPGLAKGNQSCIWAVGTHGLIRFFSWDGSNWSGETGYDIDNQETVSAFSLEAVGTLSGKVYIDQSGSFVYDSQPSTKPVNQISATGAACNEGTVLKKKGSLWSAFTQGSANYHYFNFISRTDGSGVELLDDSWNYYLYTLEDSLTTFDITPAHIASHINDTPYYFETSSETVYIHLLDPDGNCLVPDIILKNSISLTVDGSDTLKNMHPDTACVPGLIELADTLLTVILTSDSVHFSVKARRAAFNAISYKYYWTYPTFQTSNPWSKYDQLSIKLGDQTLEIIYGSPTPISDNYNQKLKQQPIVQSKNNQLMFTIPQNKIHAISIYNSAGKQLSSIKIGKYSNRIYMPVSISSGLIFVEYLFKDGSIQRSTLPVVK